MPKCRRDQRGFAICLVVMVTVETLAVFTVMHLEHRAAEENAEERRAELQRAGDSGEIFDELEDLSLEEQWADNLVRKKRGVAQQIMEDSESKDIDSLADSLHGELLGSKYGENPKIRKVSMMKELAQDKNSVHNEDSWLAEPLPESNKRVFIKDVHKGKDSHKHNFPSKKARLLVAPSERSKSRSGHTGSRPRPHVVNLYRDITSL